MAARILTMGAGQARWPPAARGRSPPSARLNWPAGPPGLRPGLSCLVPLPLLPPDDAPGLLPLVAPGRALPLPPPPRLLPGSAGLRCCGCCCFLARGGRLKNCPGSGCGQVVCRGGERGSRRKQQQVVRAKFRLLPPLHMQHGRRARVRNPKPKRRKQEKRANCVQ